jgi:metal-dependent amidase/aminoacylase/carboxypeptidase family protein
MSNQRMDLVIADALAEVERVRGDLRVEVQWHDVFRSVVNDAGATEIARKAAQSIGLATHEMAVPMRWSEDFGRFGDDGAHAAMVYVGSGEGQPQLHNPDYDFPDDLLPDVIGLFRKIVDDLLGISAG